MGSGDSWRKVIDCKFCDKFRSLLGTLWGRWRDIRRCDIGNGQVTPSILSSATWQFAPPATGNATAYWNTIKVFLESLPSLVDGDLQLDWTLTPEVFLISSVTGFDVEQAKIGELFAPTISSLEAAKISYAYTSSVATSFLSYYEFGDFGANVSNKNLAGRLLSPLIVQNSTDTFISILQTIVSNKLIFAGVTLDVNTLVVANAPAISINLYWRQTLMTGVFGDYLDHIDFEQGFETQNFMTDTIMPALAALTPNGTADLNEADFQQPDWQNLFFSEDFNRLGDIKANYDPQQISYALGAVGSEKWKEKLDGRLYRARYMGNDVMSIVDQIRIMPVE